MSQPLLSVVVPCMGRLHHLKLTAPNLLAQPEIEYILVDYSCPDRCGDYIREHWPHAKVVSVPGQEFFDRSKARNLGVRAASTPWLAILDADNVVSLDFARRVLTLLSADGRIMLRSGVPQNGGTLVCALAAFQHAGGYDERFEGWGSEDWDLTLRLMLGGLRQVRLPPDVLGALCHDDGERVRFHRQKSTIHSDRSNKARVPFRLLPDLNRPWPDPVTLGLFGPTDTDLWRSVQYAAFVQRAHRVAVQLYTGWHGTLHERSPSLLMDRRALAEEIAAQLELSQPLPITDRAPFAEVHWPTLDYLLSFPTLPARQTWSGWSTGLRRRIAFHLANDLAEDEQSAAELQAALPQCEFVQLELADGVAACAATAARCDVFVGGDNAMVQLCYAVGLPVFLLADYPQDGKLRAAFLERHVNQPAILCPDLADLRFTLRCFLNL
jgi:hypothetical protein